MTRERALTKLELSPAIVSGTRGWVQARWRRRDGSKGDVFAHFRPKTEERWYLATILLDYPTSARLRDVPLARIEQAANADAEISQWIMESSELELDAQGRRIWPRHRLKRPTGRRLDDAFYARVATAYIGAVAHGLNPAKTLAEDSDTPQGTVNRWIATAREKGMLPATTPGKVIA